jgi:proton glutamate symport protein
MKKNIPLYLKIIIGMVIGVFWGLLAIVLHWETFTIHWIKPWGTIFLNLLKLVAVPLIFISLVKGVSSLSDISRLSRIGLKTFALFLITTVIAISLGLLLVNMMKPGHTFPEERRTELQAEYSGSVAQKETLADQVKGSGPLKIIVDMVPENIISAAGDNSRILQIIFFAMLFGIALALVPGSKVASVKAFFDGLYEVIMKIIEIIMRFAPYGVFALMGTLVVEFAGDNISESISLFKALGMYMMTVIIGMGLVLFIVFPLFVRLFSPIGFRDFFRGIGPAQLVAFSTSSSAATLPVSMEQVQSKFGVSEQIASFVLPIGVTINMAGTSIYQAISAVFIAQAFGIELNLSAQLAIVLTATLASIGTPGVPAAGIVMLVIVLTAIGLPAEGLALVLALDRPLDMLRTVVNITGDCAVAAIVAKSEGELDYPPKEPSE